MKGRGKRAEHLMAYMRELGYLCALTVVPRWLAASRNDFGQTNLREFWQDTTLTLPRETPRSWRNIFTDLAISGHLSDDNQTLLVGDLLAQFPVAVLIPEQSELSGSKIDLVPRARLSAVHWP